MAQYASVMRDDEAGEIDYTPVSAVAVGDIVVLGTDLVCVSPRAIAAGVKGSLAIRSIITAPKVTGAVTLGTKLYWNSTGDPVGGTAGTGAMTTTSSAGPFAGKCTLAAGSGDYAVEMMLMSGDAATSTARSALGQDDLAPYVLALSTWQAAGTGAQLGATAGTPSGAFGLTIGTFGSATPLILGESASGNSKTDAMRRQFALPVEYVSGQAITIRVRARRTGTLATSNSLDCECYVGDGAGGVGSDICATAANTALTTSEADYDFTITPTSRVAGDVLDIKITGIANDTGGTNAKLIEIGKVTVLLSVKG